MKNLKITLLILANICFFFDSKADNEPLNMVMLTGSYDMGKPQDTEKPIVKELGVYDPTSTMVLEKISVQNGPVKSSEGTFCAMAAMPLILDLLFLSKHLPSNVENEKNLINKFEKQIIDKQNDLESELNKLSDTARYQLSEDEEHLKSLSIDVEKLHESKYFAEEDKKPIDVINEIQSQINEKTILYENVKKKLDASEVYKLKKEMSLLQNKIRLDKRILENKINDFAGIKQIIGNLNTRYDCYVSPKKGFVVFVLKKQEKKLEELGLISELEKIELHDLDDTISYPDQGPVDVKDLMSVFSKNYIIQKNIYIVGHGGPATSLIKNISTSPYSQGIIAAFSYEQYQEFLAGLNQYNCNFLTVVSCFAGGLNSVVMHLKQEIEDIKKIVKIKVDFPIAILGIGDMPIKFSEDTDFKSYFKSLNDFFSLRNMSKPSDLKYWVRNPFRTILSHVTGKDLWETPSVLFPGDNTYFNLTAIGDDLGIVSYPTLLAHELAPLLDKSLKEKIVHIKKNTPMVFKDKKAVLLFPSIITVPLKLEGSVPLLISMIHGNALHFITELDCLDLSGTLIKRFAEWPFANKACFVQQLKILNEKQETQILKNVLLIGGDGLRRVAGDKTMFVGDNEESVKKIQEIVDYIKPNKEATLEATGGIEGIERAKKKIKQILDDELKKLKKE